MALRQLKPDFEVARKFFDPSRTSEDRGIPSGQNFPLAVLWSSIPGSGPAVPTLAASTSINFTGTRAVTMQCWWMNAICRCSSGWYVTMKFTN